MSITGDLINSEIVDGQQEFIWEIPAVREQAAIRKANLNSRIKGLENVNVLDVQRIGDGRFPGQTNFRVTLESSR